MAVITHLSTADVEQALAPYAVGTLAGFKGATEGIENTNYFIRTSRADGAEGEYVLTLIEEAGAPSAYRQAMITILDRCVDEGLPVPQIIRTAQGAAESSLLGKPMLLCSKLEGMHVVNPLRSQCGAIGRFLARFHHVTAPIQEEVEPYIRDHAWLAEKTATVKARIPPIDRSTLEATLKTVTDLLSRADVNELPRSVIHADLFQDNALFNTHGLTGVLDFHHAGRGFCIYDIAIAINDWCRSGDVLDEERTLALLRGYDSIRSLTQQEMWFLPTFLLYAALSFWLSRLMISVRTDLPSHYPVRDPDEFKALVQRHTRSPFNVVRESLV